MGASLEEEDDLPLTKKMISSNHIAEERLESENSIVGAVSKDPGPKKRWGVKKLVNKLPSKFNTSDEGGLLGDDSSKKGISDKSVTSLDRSITSAFRKLQFNRRRKPPGDLDDSSTLSFKSNQTTKSQNDLIAQQRLLKMRQEELARDIDYFNELSTRQGGHTVKNTILNK